jgi:hypothetical protein
MIVEGYIASYICPADVRLLCGGKRKERGREQTDRGGRGVGRTNEVSSDGFLRWVEVRVKDGRDWQAF